MARNYSRRIIKAKRDSIKGVGLGLGLDLWVWAWALASGSRRQPRAHHEYTTSHRNIATMWPQLSPGKVLSFVLQDLITRNYRMPQGDPFTLEGLNTTGDGKATGKVPFPPYTPNGETWSLIPLDILPNFMQIEKGNTRKSRRSCHSQLFQLNWDEKMGQWGGGGCQDAWPGEQLVAPFRVSRVIIVN